MVGPSPRRGLALAQSLLGECWPWLALLLLTWGILGFISQ